jgi:hypothetical protein
MTQNVGSVESGFSLLRDRCMSFLVIDIGNTRLKWGLYATARTGSELLAHGAVVLEDIDLPLGSVLEKPDAQAHRDAGMRCGR